MRPEYVLIGSNKWLHRVGEDELWPKVVYPYETFSVNWEIGGSTGLHIRWDSGYGFPIYHLGFNQYRLEEVLSRVDLEIRQKVLLFLAFWDSDAVQTFLEALRG